jgi:hypothetical protein
MSWQDELRRLDEELASGRISADDYRSRRDQIMASAVSPTNQAAPGPAAESTTVMSPVQPPAGPRPGGGTDDVDRTQIVSGQQMDADRTQAVGWRATPPEDPNRTQVVPGVPPQNFAGARPPRPAPGPQGGYQTTPPPWENEEPMAGPWAGQEFPALGANTPDWALQGPEVFQTDKKSGKGKAIGIIVVVVVLLGLAAGAYFLFKPKANNNQAGGNTGGDDKTSSAPATTTTTKPKGPIADLPGDVSDAKDVTTFTKVVELNYLTKDEIAVYQQGQAGDATMATAKDGEIVIVVLVTEHVDEAAATSVAQQLDGIQQQFNHMTPRTGMPTGVLASANEQASRGPIVRAHYASGKNVVRVQVQGPNLNEVNDTFDQILNDQLDRLPANG